MKRAAFLTGAALLFLSTLACSIGTPGDNQEGASTTSGTVSSSGVTVGVRLDGEGAALAGGTRLKVQYIQGADGSRRLLNFWDTQLNLSCDFFALEGGGSACVPASNATFLSQQAPLSGAISFYFEDASCSRPVLYTTASAPVPDHVVGVGIGNGGYVAQGVYRIGSALNLPDGGTVTFYSRVLSAGTMECRSTTISLPGYALYSSGQEIPLSQFVQGSVQREP